MSRSNKESTPPATRDGWVAGISHISNPPLVSLVLINWNYAAYVGHAISSIKSQDYTNLEVLIVDNGSTDSSRSVIADSVGDSRQIRVLHLDENLGQLGAFLHVFNLIRGEFVSIVDADDIICPHYVSSHLQVHLALPSSLAFTSSNVVEITADGRTLTGGYAAFGTTRQPVSRGLRPIGSALRLSTISDDDYLQLDRSTSTYSGGASWMWGPGTANMYRRSVLALAHQEPKDRVYFRAADSYFNYLCHAFGGSALIDRHLSAYRVHDKNYFAERESVHNLRKGRLECQARHGQERRELIHFLFERAEHFEPLLSKKRYWEIVCQFAGGLRKRSGKFRSNPASLQLFIDNYESLRLAFGETYLLSKLRQLLSGDDLWTVIRRVHGGSVPFRLRLDLWKRRGGPVRARTAHAVKRVAELVKASSTGKSAISPPKVKNEPTAASQQATVGFGPAASVSVDPPIFMTGIAFEEHLGIAPEFGRIHGSLPAGFLIYPCWTIEDRDRSTAIIAAAKAHNEKYPAHELVFLCNTAAERDVLATAGLVAHFLNKNFAVSETTFRPLNGIEVEFDAIYNARFDLMKRHELARGILRVAYLSYEDSTNSVEMSAKGRELLAKVLAKHPHHVLLNSIENGLPVRLSPEDVNVALNRAAVGLCLSSVEGSNYASMEYMLAGLPVVSTPSLGGREVYFDHEYCTICEANPSAVREAVATLKARNIPRDYIRSRTLAKIEPARQSFLSHIDDLRQRLGGERRHHEGIWPFGTSEFLKWKTFKEHISDFNDARRSLRRDKIDHVDPHIEQLLTNVDGIQMQLPELRTILGSDPIPSWLLATSFRLRKRLSHVGTDQPGWDNSVP